MLNELTDTFYTIEASVQAMHIYLSLLNQVRCNLSPWPAGMGNGTLKAALLLALLRNDKEGDPRFDGFPDAPEKLRPPHDRF